MLQSLAIYRGKAEIQKKRINFAWPNTAAAYGVFITQTAFITVSLIVSPT